MTTCDSVSEWVSRARHSDEQALQNLWQRFSPRLVRLARSKLPRRLRRTSDEEDLALRAFESYVARVERGDLGEIDNRTDFWNAIALIIARKAYADVRAETCLKRGGGRVRGESALWDELSTDSWDALTHSNPSPSQIFASHEWLAAALENLADAELRRIACYKYEGYSNLEISRLIGRSLPTVERRLRLIRARLLMMVGQS